MRALYNPALMSRADCGPDALLHQTVADRLLAALRRDAGEGAPQHQLVLGPRGSGKTVLLRVLGHLIEDDAELAARWFPLTFPEAQYDVARLADLWTNALDYLAVALLRRGHAAEAREVHDAVKALPVDDEEARAEEAFRLLLAESDALGRRFVLLVDNLDVVLDRLQSHQWRVRDILSAERRLLVIGASARAIEATYRYEAAFYDFFRIYELRPLPAAAVPRALGLLAAPDAKKRVAAAVASAPHRVRAVTSVIGTLPRALELA
ncbi:MAG: ATP-binding protein, partial [Myxococcales bacterium]|nr:ATP-binding protein [Myxococcales bacterium]